MTSRLCTLCLKSHSAESWKTATLKCPEQSSGQRGEQSTAVTSPLCSALRPALTQSVRGKLTAGDVTDIGKSFKHLAREWSHGPSYWSGGGDCKSAGVAILIRGNAFTLESFQELVCGRLLVVDGNWGGEPVRFINVYAPPLKNERLEVFQTLRLQLATTRTLVMAGDFNCPIEEDVRSSDTSAKLDITSKLLIEMVTEARLEDVVGSMGRGSVNYSWSRPDGSLRSRIDFVFTSRAVRQSRYSMVPCFFSDHRAIRLQCVLGHGFPPGPGSWKLNCALLTQSEVVEELRAAYATWRSCKGSFRTICDWWEYVKLEFRCFFQAKSQLQARERRRDFRGLQRQLRSLQDLLHCGWDVREELDEAKRGLKRHFEEESRRIIFRSKVENMEKGEKCNSFFFRKLHAGHMPLSELRDESGNIRRVKEDVMRVISDFYSDLYSHKTTNPDAADKFLSGITNHLDPAGAATMDKPLTVGELLAAAKSFRTGRTPGSDGLPAELYVTLGDLICRDLLELYEEMVVEGRMPPSLREGMVMILYKRKGERCDLKNWRPITLLNVDYKILAKTMATRLKTVIGRIIHPDQTCGVPGRRIADSLALVRDTVEYIKVRRAHAALVSLDQEKAFDRVSHGFMGRALQRLGLGDRFCSYVRLMYFDIHSLVLVNGWKTDPFPVLSGVRQGCPLSPLLFVCVIELFAEAIRQNGEIRGITAPGPERHEVKCSLYMDDVTVFCADRGSVDALVQTCEMFGQASGVKVNCGKSEAMIFGDWQLASSAPFPFNIQLDFIKLLGVWFGKEGAALKSWQERLAKVNQRIGLWNLRHLTCEGKVLVLRNEVLPVLQYTAQAWPPHVTVCRAITRTVFHFVWGSKMHRVRRAVMYKEPRKGGKGVPDIPTLLRSSFVCDCVRRTLQVKRGSAGRSMSRFFLLPLWRRLGWDKWDSSYPYNWTTPWFYGDVVRFVGEHQLEGLKPDLWKTKTIHKLIRAKDDVEDIIGLHQDTLETVWTNVSSDRLTNGHKDLSWMAIQGGLPVRSFMHARNLCKTRYCPRCPFVEETSLHTFWECRFAQRLLTALEDDLRNSVPRASLSHHSVLYGLFPGVHTVGAIQEAWRLMNCFKDAIWVARNRLILRREKMSIQDCRRLIHSLLRDYSIVDGPEDADEDKD
ncbi:unnamed protein product [Ranitomeya imitator]|uniref:Reverse transcriptase domain-containing protein n=1 Tax=Ranitomeya imitator TaxID=111125 RepID=A0ABN9MIB6_9NEOB|nr:unnamed protein product [Ranitomeya imitator]